MSIKVLHFTPDDKFFDEAFSAWEKISDFDNEAIYYANVANHCLKYIKNTSKLKIYSDESSVAEFLRNGDYSIIYFHSLQALVYRFFKYIPKDKIVIVWGWGFDLYYENVTPSPLIPVDLYKPITKQYKENGKTFSLRLVCLFRKVIKNLIYEDLKRYVISRIDYYQPVTKAEFLLMQQVRGFRAKEFYYDGSLPHYDISLKQRRRNGNILLGNSATATNNHLDVLSVVKEFRKSDQTVIIPLNYGGEDDYLELLKKGIQNEDGIRPLFDFLSLDEYTQVLDSCSYACFGAIRQQALGNIRYAITHGIKVFLYKASVTYKSLNDLGFAVFSIEDIDASSFEKPLTTREMEQNRIAWENEIKRRHILFEDAMATIKGLK